MSPENCRMHTKCQYKSEENIPKTTLKCLRWSTESNDISKSIERFWFLFHLLFYISYVLCFVAFILPIEFYYCCYFYKLPRHTHASTTHGDARITTDLLFEYNSSNAAALVQMYSTEDRKKRRKKQNSSYPFAIGCGCVYPLIHIHSTFTHTIWMHTFDLFYVYAYDYLMSYERFYYYVTILWRIKSFWMIHVSFLHNVRRWKFLCRTHTHSRVVVHFMYLSCVYVYIYKMIETRGECIPKKRERRKYLEYDT